MAAFDLHGPLLSIWTALIEERLGLHYAAEDRELLESKLSTRAMESGFDSLLDYYYYLRYDADSAAEMEALVEALVVNETYFFRESAPLRILRDTVIEPLVKTGGRPRIWCAACSTGEEPLTLSMLLAERGLGSKVSIVATDISQRVLRRAKEGVFGHRSLRALPPGLPATWLNVVDNQARVASELYDPITWQQLNLMDRAAVAALGKFDAILCRNVLIYFSDETVRQVVSTLGEALVDSAPLVVGASESLLRFGTLLECQERAGAFFYVKARHG